jgi:hypothetical protein
LKEQNDIRRSKLADLKSRRSALNSPPKQRGCDEFKSLGQASSELIARLGNRAKVGVKDEETQPPSKITQGENVIYLNSNDVQNLRTSNQRNKAKHDQKKDDACELFYIFQ